MIPKPKEKPPWSLRASGLLALGRTLSARIRVRDVHGKPWERPEWLRLKEYLLSGLTESLLRELYSLIFLNEDILIQPSWVLQFHQEISDLPGDKLFLLWWIFFDEVATTAHRTKEYELDNNFHLQQVYGLHGDQLCICIRLYIYISISCHYARCCRFSANRL